MILCNKKNKNEGISWILGNKMFAFGSKLGDIILFFDNDEFLVGK